MSATPSFPSPQGGEGGAQRRVRAERPVGPASIALENVRRPGIADLLALSDAYAAERYPPEGNFAFSIDELEHLLTKFVVERPQYRSGFFHITVINGKCHGYTFCFRYPNAKALQSQ